MSSSKSVSPTRNYVAICPKGNFDGHYFRTFHLPEIDAHTEQAYENNSSVALWFFMNRLNHTAMMELCVTLEDFRDVSPEKQNADGSSRMFDFPPTGSPRVVGRLAPGGEVTVGLTCYGMLADDPDAFGSKLGLEVRYRADGTVAAAVVNDARQTTVTQFYISGRTEGTSYTSRRFVEARLDVHEQVEGEWRFSVGDGKITIAIKDGTVVVHHYMTEGALVAA